MPGTFNSVGAVQQLGQIAAAGLILPFLDQERSHVKVRATHERNVGAVKRCFELCLPLPSGSLGDSGVRAGNAGRRLQLCRDTDRPCTALPTHCHSCVARSCTSICVSQTVYMSGVHLPVCVGDWRFEHICHSAAPTLRSALLPA